MRVFWIVGVAHGLVGTGIFFLTLHPLRDALDAHALDLAKVGAAWQAMQGLVLMLVAATTQFRIAASFIAAGTTIAAAMLYFIIFSGMRPPLIVLVPIGGSIAMLGWAILLFARPR